MNLYQFRLQDREIKEKQIRLLNFARLKLQNALSLISGSTQTLTTLGKTEFWLATYSDRFQDLGLESNELLESALTRFNQALNVLSSREGAPRMKHIELQIADILCEQRKATHLDVHTKWIHIWNLYYPLISQPAKTNESSKKKTLVVDKEMIKLFKDGIEEITDQFLLTLTIDDLKGANEYQKNSMEYFKTNMFPRRGQIIGTIMRILVLLKCYVSKWVQSLQFALTKNQKNKIKMDWSHEKFWCTRFPKLRGKKRNNPDKVTTIKDKNGGAKDYIFQQFYWCVDCDIVIGKGCCRSCAKICHAGHKLFYADKAMVLAFCDCTDAGCCRLDGGLKKPIELPPPQPQIQPQTPTHAHRFTLGEKRSSSVGAAFTQPEEITLFKPLASSTSQLTSSLSGEIRTKTVDKKTPPTNYEAKGEFLMGGYIKKTRWFCKELGKTLLSVIYKFSYVLLQNSTTSDRRSIRYCEFRRLFM